MRVSISLILIPNTTHPAFGYLARGLVADPPLDPFCDLAHIYQICTPCWGLSQLWKGGLVVLVDGRGGVDIGIAPIPVSPLPISGRPVGRIRSSCMQGPPYLGLVFGLAWARLVLVPEFPILFFFLSSLWTVVGWTGVA